ncbi:hypothetical protein OYT40_002169 [Escherichia coli]|nr:hypothetical protein [Escherichia coli]
MQQVTDFLPLEKILFSMGVVAEEYLNEVVRYDHPELNQNEQWILACKYAGKLRKDTKSKLQQLLIDADNFENELKNSRNRKNG